MFIFTYFVLIIVLRFVKNILPLGTWDLKGVDHHDFEDITQGEGPNPGISYIYLGDIGNNDYDREEIYIYRFPEPDISSM